jgi:hypothetical protein
VATGAVTDKVDLKRALDSYRATKGAFRTLEVPVANYLMVDGHGDPNISPQFTAALETLYPVAYTLKFASKRELDRDYVVPPLEGLWWADDMDAFTTARDKSNWHWTLMLMVPDWLDEHHVGAAIEKARATKPLAAEIRFESLSEGLCVQTLHIGSFDSEAAILQALHTDFIPANGLRMTGRHHEVYLSDTRKTAPEKQRTILRQPVAAV